MATTRTATATKRKPVVVRDKRPLKPVADSQPGSAAAAERRPKGEQLEFDLSKALDDMDEKFVYCRDVMHAWQPYTARQQSDGTFKSTMKCPRCETFKIRILNRYGSILDTWYDYPEGYLISGAGRLTTSARDVIRLRSLRNTMAQFEKDEEPEAVKIHA